MYKCKSVYESLWASKNSSLLAEKNSPEIITSPIAIRRLTLKLLIWLNDISKINRATQDKKLTRASEPNLHIPLYSANKQRPLYQVDIMQEYMISDRI